MKSRDELATELLQMINLVAFDVCDISTLQFIDDADPLKFTLQCRMVAPIPHTLHAHLRQNIKDATYREGWAAGRIGLDRVLSIVLYQQRRFAPAYVHGESPQG